MQNPMTIRLAMLVSSVCLAACSGSGQGLDSGGRPVGPGGVGDGALTADFASIQSHVFTPICTVCHAGGAAPQGLRLDAANSYALLVGVPSNEVPGILRVKSGDPDNSYIVQKLEGHASVGAQMPFGGPPLPAATIAVIRAWIAAGAAPAVAVAMAPFAVVASEPAKRDVLFAPVLRLVVGFNREIDQTRFDATSLELERVGAAGAEGLAVSLRVATGSPGTLLLEPQAPLQDGHYRVVVRGAPSTGIASIGGERLAPTPGGHVVTEFDVVELP
jgi:hypothetical protein